MRTVEVSRTLVKSPPELWSELSGERLSEAVGGASLRVTEEERRIEWESEGARGAAVLEPAGWGTKLTLTAEVEVLSVKPDKPVCQLRATITNQEGTVVLEGECWTYTMRPAGAPA